MKGTKDVNVVENKFKHMSLFLFKKLEMHSEEIFDLAESVSDFEMDSALISVISLSVIIFPFVRPIIKCLWHFAKKHVPYIRNRASR